MIDAPISIPAKTLRQCVVLAGPTAVGKTALSLRLATELNAEILSMDSMAVYRGMNVGTAKPDAAARSQVKHHLIDIASPSDEFSVADYVTQAAQTAAELVSQGKTPLFVGGTGLYLRAILRGVVPGPAPDWAFRKEMEAAAETHGNQWLWDQVAAIDPITADRLPSTDQRRLIRALEVHRVTGQPLSSMQQQVPQPAGDRPRLTVWLRPPRDWLRKRIGERVQMMMEQGFEEEVRDLKSSAATLGRTASQALGYRELLTYLEGQGTLKEAVEQIILHTRQFAKRQYTWFRNLEECTPLDTGPDHTVESLLKEFLDRLRRNA